MRIVKFCSILHDWGLEYQILKSGSFSVSVACEDIVFL